MLVCPKCEGVDTFIKKGKINGVQKYKCVNVLEDGHICGSRTQPIYVEDGQESELNDILRANKLLAKSNRNIWIQIALSVNPSEKVLVWKMLLLNISKNLKLS